MDPSPSNVSQEQYRRLQQLVAELLKKNELLRRQVATQQAGSSTNLL